MMCLMNILFSKLDFFGKLLRVKKRIIQNWFPQHSFSNIFMAAQLKNAIPHIIWIFKIFKITWAMAINLF